MNYILNIEHRQHLSALSGSLQNILLYVQFPC